MPARRIVRLERLVVDGAGKDRWFLRPGSRRGRWLWFDADRMPSVGDARAAMFELEQVRGGTWVSLDGPPTDLARRAYQSRSRDYSGPR